MNESGVPHIFEYTSTMKRERTRGQIESLEVIHSQVIGPQDERKRAHAAKHSASKGKEVRIPGGLMFRLKRKLNISRRHIGRTTSLTGKGFIDGIHGLIHGILITHSVNKGMGNHTLQRESDPHDK